jgi:predicted RNase H-like HicB family nuclease
MLPLISWYQARLDRVGLFYAMSPRIIWYIEVRGLAMKFTIESEQEEDGRWLAEVLELPGVMVYGQTRQEALAKAQALALRVLAERLEHGEMLAEPINILFAAA